MNKKDIYKIRNRIDFLYNYRFDSLDELVAKLRPLTDELLDEIQKLSTNK